MWMSFMKLDEMMKTIKHATFGGIPEQTISFGEIKKCKFVLIKSVFNAKVFIF